MPTGFIFNSSSAWGSSVSACSTTKLAALKEVCLLRFPQGYCGDWFDAGDGPEFAGAFFYPPANFTYYGFFSTCEIKDTPQPIAVTVKVDPYTSPPEHYTAINVVFGLILSALCVVWGFRQIIKIFSSYPEA